MKLPHGALADMIVKALTECGPMTRSETLLYLGLDRGNNCEVFNRLAVASPRRPQRIHVCGWAVDCEGQRRFPRKIYAVGPEPAGLKVKKPALSRDKAARAKYSKERYLRHKGASVFTWGMGWESIRAHHAKLKEAA